MNVLRNYIVRILESIDDDDLRHLRIRKVWRSVWIELKYLGVVCWFVGCKRGEAGWCVRCYYITDSEVIYLGGIFRWLWIKIKKIITLNRLRCWNCRKLTINRPQKYGERFCSKKCEETWLPF